MLVQVTGTKMLRDTESMALINKDINGLEEYNLKRKMAASQRNEINTIKSDLLCFYNNMIKIKINKKNLI